VNVFRLSLPSERNAAYGTTNPDLELPPGHASVELGLVHGPVVDDADYIRDYSGPGEEPGAARRYRTLADALEPAVLASWRLRVVKLLESLLRPGESWYLFVRGELDHDVAAPAEYFAGKVQAAGLELSGSFSIIEVPAGQLDQYSRLFGDGDRIVGLIAPAGTLRVVLSRLHLSDALPTSRRSRVAGPYPSHESVTLDRLLAHGRLFAEEIDNGTRLRVITRANHASMLRARLSTLVAGSIGG
jgi:hypothetical protein